MKLINHIYDCKKTLKECIEDNKVESYHESVLIQLFSSVVDKVFLEELSLLLHRLLPHATIIGTTTAGEIADGKMHDHTTLISFSLFNDVTIRSSYLISEDAYSIGEVLATDITTEQTKVVIMFADGLKLNGDLILNGFASACKESFPIAGGMAGDMMAFEQTYIIYNDKVFDQGVVAVALESDTLIVNQNYNLSWKPIGKEMIITSSEGNRVYEIDNQPIIDIYREYLGDEVVSQIPASTIEFPLISKYYDIFSARSMIAKLEDDSILFAGDMPQGQNVRFGMASESQFYKTSQKTYTTLSKEPVEAVFIYSCVARKTLLGQKLEEYEFKILNSIASTSGFFTYGEFYSSSSDGKMLNITTTILTLSESNIKSKVKTYESIQQDQHNLTTTAALHLLNKVAMDLREKEQELDKAEELLSQYKLSIDTTFIISKTDLYGVITYVNDKFCKLSGYSRDELIGKNHNITRHPDTKQEVFKNLWQTIQEGKIWKGEMKNLSKDGNTYYVTSFILPVFNDNGSIVEYFGIRHDITEVNNARIKAEEAEAFKSLFLANMSHEIRTPMSAILGFSKLLDQTQLNPLQRNYTSTIHSSSKLLLGIINDILDLSKIQNDKLVIELVPSNSQKEFKEAFKLLESTAIKKKIQYKLEIDPMIYECLLMDPVRVQQVIVNFLSNAIKFTPENGSVLLKIESLEESDNQQKICINVIDTGIGIAQHKLNMIFEPFSQADISTARKFGGTGLGLTISMNLIKLMGSMIHVKSTEGEGSHFYFELNLTKCDLKEIPSDIKQTDGVPNYKELSILVAEDYEVNQMLMEEVFKGYQIDADYAHDGKEAVSLALKNQYDLIFMDINMPNMDGIEATNILREKGLKTPIVALTANALREDRVKYMEMGMDDYLSKPIEFNEFDRVLSYYAPKDMSSHSETSLLEQADEIVQTMQDKTGFPKEIIIKLLQSFLNSSIPTLKEIKEAIQEKNYELLSESLHKIKGAAGNLRIINIYEITKLLEASARESKEMNYESEVEKIENDIAKLKVWLENNI